MAEKSPVKTAQLDETNLTKLRALETELGSRIVAFEKQYPLANLSEEQLKRLQAAEKELDVVLIAYA
jgi:hypothetical protein